MGFNLTGPVHRLCMYGLGGADLTNGGAAKQGLNYRFSLAALLTQVHFILHIDTSLFQASE